MAQIRFSPQAADKLLDKIKEFGLGKPQLSTLKKAISALEKNPYIGIEHTEPVSTQFAIEKYLGKRLWLILHYDVERSVKLTTVKIKGLFIGYKM